MSWRPVTETNTQEGQLVKSKVYFGSVLDGLWLIDLIGLAP